jgi:hyperosmotically inducible protein
VNVILVHTSNSKLQLSGVIKSTVTAFALTLAFGVHAQDATSAAAPTIAATLTSPKAENAANRALVKKVRHALARTKGLSPANIYVKAVDGTVTLTGNCVSNDQIALAGYAAEKVAGVNSVNNRLGIGTPR